jgi:hypothetical protein
VGKTGFRNKGEGRAWSCHQDKNLLIRHHHNLFMPVRGVSTRVTYAESELDVLNEGRI